MKSWPKKIKAGNAVVTVYKRTTPAGNETFQVRWTGEHGPETENKPTADEALLLADQKVQVLARFGQRVAETSADDIAQLARCQDILRPFNVPVLLAVESVAGWLRTHGSLDGINTRLNSAGAGPVLCSKTVADVAKEMCDRKESDGAVDKKYLARLRWQYRKFSADFAVSISSVTGEQIQTWLDVRKLKAVYYNNTRRELAVVFNYAVRRGYIPTNPVNRVETRTNANRDAAITVFTPDEINRLLNAAPDDIRPALVLCCLAGIRVAEVLRLSWAAVDFEQRVIILEAGQAKTLSRRTIELRDSLLSWLLPFKGHSGKVFKGDENAFWRGRREVIKAAKVTWKKNAPRHSFISYQFAATKDAASVSAEAGNSPTILHAHYKALVKPDAAKQWAASAPAPA